MKVFNAPIAGANYTADTRNYPWHRPPDLVEYDGGVGYILNKLKEDEQLELVFSLIKIDAKISTIVTSILMQAISRGKFSIDLAILIAGPIARYISIIADEQDLKYDMGVGDEDRVVITPTSLKVALGILDDDEKEDVTIEVLEQDNSIVDGGIMAAPPEDASGMNDIPATPDEQAAMLGQIEEEEEPVDELS